MSITSRAGSDRRPLADGSTTTFAALGSPQYRILWIGSVVSFLAMQTQVIARGWLAFDITGSNSGLGGVFLGFGIPMLLLAPLGGVAADRFPKRRVLQLSQAALTLNTALVAAAIVFDFINYGHLVASSVVQGAGFAFLGPVRMSFTGDLVGHHLLPNAVVLQQMSMNATRVLGPSVAGTLIGISWFGVGGVYCTVAVLLFLSFAITFWLPQGLPDPNKVPRSPGRELLDGLVYVRERRQLLLLLLVSFLIVMIAFPYQAFLPSLAEDVYDVGPSGYGILSAFSAVGALGASLFIASRAGGPRAWRLQAGAGVLFAAGVLALGLTRTFPVGLLVIMVTGAGASAFQSLNNSLVLTNSDPEYHGRMQALMSLGFSGFGMAALPLGVAADAISLPTTLVLMGGVSLAVMAVTLVVRKRLNAGGHADAVRSTASA